MITTYSGQLVRIRPFASEAEWAGFTREYAVMPNAHRGPQWYFANSALQVWNLFPTEETVCRFAVDRLDTGELAGVITCGLGRWQLSGFTGTGLLERHWHNGFGREAKLLASCHLFENFPIESLWSDTVATHSRAIAGLEAIGYRFAGILACAFPSQGEYEGQVWYQLLRKDWERMDYRQEVRRS
ncbi:GNAT family N-acetyltransferase [bacterium]|nr:GNAT family N-acetyltransferase [bacterium]